MATAITDKEPTDQEIEQLLIADALKKTEPTDEEITQLLIDNELNAIQSEENKNDTLKQITVGALGAAEGVAPWFATEFASRVSGEYQVAKTKQLEADFEKELLKRGITEKFPVSNQPGMKEYTQQAREYYQGIKQEFPKTSVASEVISSLFAPLPKVLTTVPKALEATKLAQDATTAAKALEIAKASGRGAVTGAKTGLALGALKTGTEAIESATGGKELTSEDAAINLVGLPAVSAGIGAALPPVAAGLMKGAKLGIEGTQRALDFGAKYTIPVFLGPGKPSAIERFIQKGREKRLSGTVTEAGAGSLAMTSKDVKDEIDSAILKIRQDIEAGKASFEDLKRAEKDALDRIKTAQKNAVGDAKENLKIQDQRIREQVKWSQNIIEKKLGDEYAKKVSSASKNVLELLGQESEKSYEILEEARKSGIKIDLSDVPAFIQKILNGPDLKLGRTELNNPPANRARAVLNNLLTNFKNYYRKGISPTTVKDLLKNQIDILITESSTNPNSAEFSEISEKALLELRRHIDFKIKSYAPYAAQMRYVYALQKLRQILSNKILGRDDAKILPVLRKVTNTFSNEYKALAVLQNLTGIDLLPEMHVFMAYKNMTPEQVQIALAQHKANLENVPEYQDVFKLVQGYEALERLPEKEYQQAIEIINAEQGNNLLAIRAAQEAKKKEILELERQLNSIGGFGNVDAAGNLNNHPAIRNAVLEKNPIQQIYLENLAAIAKSDDPQKFVKLIQDLKLANQFTQEFSEGGRRVYLGAGLGAASSVAGQGEIDPQTTLMLGGLGALLGGVSDRYGVSIAKRLLTVYVNMTYRTANIDRWGVELAAQNIPQDVRRAILQGFAKQVQSGPDEPVSVDPSRRAELYDEIKASPMDSVTKAQAMDMIAKNGQVPGWVVKKLMLNEEAPRAVIMPKNRAEILNADRPEGLRK